MSAIRHWAITGSLVLHVVALGWIMYQPAGSLSFQVDEPVVQAPSMMQISLRPDQSASISSVISQSETPAQVKHQESVPLTRPARSPDIQTPGLIPDYYPAKELSKMPFALTDMEALLPAVLIGLEHGTLHVRLWLSQSGDVDRSVMLESELPTDIENAVLASLRNMRFMPGEINNIPVKVWVDIVVEYGENAGMNTGLPVEVKSVSPIQSSQ